MLKPPLDYRTNRAKPPSNHSNKANKTPLTDHVATTSITLKLGGSAKIEFADKFTNDQSLNGHMSQLVDKSNFPTVVLEKCSRNSHLT